MKIINYKHNRSSLGRPLAIRCDARLGLSGARRVRPGACALLDRPPRVLDGGPGEFVRERGHAPLEHSTAGLPCTLAAYMLCDPANRANKK